MEPAELRIGNKFYLPNGEVGTITYHEIRLMVVSSEKPNYKPIPLTEEWLLRFGWIWNEGTKSFEKLGFPQGHIRKTSFGWTMFNYVLGSLTTVKNFNYVHQLQNIFYALKQQDLTVK